MLIKALGIDIAKNVFQLHGVDKTGKKPLRKKLKREEFSEELANIPACQIYLEACGGAHHWARTFTAFGHEV
jgi:transposase